LPSTPNGITSNTQTSLSGAINPGTYTANIVAAGGCATSTVITINPIPPTPSFTIVNTAGSASITCATPSIVLNSLTNYTFGTLTYFWSSNSFTSSAQSVTVTSPSTLITLQEIDPATGCAATRTTVIFQNTVVPTCTANPLNQSVNCGPGVVATVTATIISPTVNAGFSLLSPNAPVPFIVSPGTFSGTNPTFYNYAPGNFAAKAIEKLEAEGITPAHYDLRFAKPLDEAMLHEVFARYKKIITIEDGTIVGGVGSAILEFMAENNYSAQVKLLGIPDKFIEHV
jgi:hypothetical protein